MCEGCWGEYGNPVERFEGFEKVVEAIKAVYGEDYVGGALHIQIDDFNVEDMHFDARAEERIKTEAERKCFDLLKGLTLRQRASVLAYHDGYWYCDEEEAHRLYATIGKVCPCNRQ